MDGNAVHQSHGGVSHAHSYMCDRNAIPPPFYAAHTHVSTHIPSLQGGLSKLYVQLSLIITNMCLLSSILTNKSFVYTSAPKTKQHGKKSCSPTNSRFYNITNKLKNSNSLMLPVHFIIFHWPRQFPASCFEFYWCDPKLCPWSKSLASHSFRVPYNLRHPLYDLWLGPNINASLSVKQKRLTYSMPICGYWNGWI